MHAATDGIEQYACSSPGTPNVNICQQQWDSGGERRLEIPACDRWTDLL